MKKYRQANLVQSFVIVGGLALLLLLLGWSFAGWYGVVWSLVMGVIPFIVTVRLFPHLTLKIYGARPLRRNEAPVLFDLLDELCRRALLAPPPQLFYIPGNNVLIFSVGQGDNAAVAISGGIFHLFSIRELVAVLGHEIAHVKHGDTVVMAFADVVSRITHFLSFMGIILVTINLPLLVMGSGQIPWLPILLMVTAPSVSALLQLALSRTREFDADLIGAEISGDPAGLAAALAKLEGFRLEVSKRSIIPVRGEEPSFLRTHPDTTARIQRLNEMTEDMSAITTPGEDEPVKRLAMQPFRKERG